MPSKCKKIARKNISNSIKSQLYRFQIKNNPGKKIWGLENIKDLITKKGNYTYSPKLKEIFRVGKMLVNFGTTMNLNLLQRLGYSFLKMKCDINRRLCRTKKLNIYISNLENYTSFLQLP